jgi:hypothetical protein
MQWWFGLCLAHEELLHLHAHDSGTHHDLVGSCHHVLQYIHFLHMHQPWVGEAQRRWALQRLGGDWQQQQLDSLQE